MVKKHTKYIAYDIKNLMPKLLAIMLIVMLGVAFLVGLLTTAPNMRYSVGKYYKNYNAADIIVQSAAPLTNTQIQDLKSNDLVVDAMPFFSIDEKIEIYENERMARIMLLDFNGEISLNRLELLEGRMPSINGENVEVVVERSQMYLIDIPIGYKTDALGKTFEVVGIVRHPWHFAKLQEVSQESQRAIEAVLYTDKTVLEQTVYSSVALKVVNTDKFDIFSKKYKDHVDSIVKEFEAQYDGYFYTTLNQNQSFVKFAADVKIVEIISIIFPVFFFLITILVSMSSMTRIVFDQRMQIGTLRSLGFGKFKILWKYLLYSIISSSIGSILGIGLGIYFIPAIIYNAYLTSYGLPQLVINYHFFYISVISLTLILSVVVTTIFSVLTALSEKPAELLRAKAPKPGKKTVLERVGFIWKRLKFKYKSTFRNIFRHKRNLILTLIGVTGSTALLLAGLGIKDAVALAGDYQYNKMLNYQLEIGIEDYTVQIDAIGESPSIFIGQTTAIYANEDYINIITPSDNAKLNNFIKFKNTKNKAVVFDENSVIVTNQFAKKHKIEKGGSIVLKINNVENTFVVSDIVKHYFGNHIYISSYLASQVPINKVYIQTTGNAQTQISQLQQDANVTHILTKNQMQQTFENTSKSMDSIVVVLVLFACALAVIINYNLTLINIGSRQREIATLKVLGYQEHEVSGYVFRETVIISTVAILLGILMGVLLHGFIIDQIFVDGVMLVKSIKWLSFLLTVVLSYVFLAIVYLLSLPKTKKIDMIEALKSYE